MSMVGTAEEPAAKRAPSSYALIRDDAQRAHDLRIMAAVLAAGQWRALDSESDEQNLVVAIRSVKMAILIDRAVAHETGEGVATKIT
jgi:hypothetical protein